MISTTISDLVSSRPHISAWNQLSERFPEWKRTLTQYSATDAPNIQPTHASMGIVGQFGPIRANPNDPIRSRQILQTFVFRNEGTFINSSEERLTSFVQQLLSHTTEIRSAFLENDNTRWFSLPREIKIIGEKGVGKTHLLNYIITKYKPLFDQEKILLVRLSLTRNAYLDQSTNLTDWFRAQAAKILVRYYDKRSLASNLNPTRPFDFASHLTDFIRSKFPMHAELFFSKMYRMIQILHDPVKDRDISPQWMDTVLVEEIYAHAVRNGWGFVIALDQNDLLSHSKTTQELYRTREKQVFDYRTASTPVPCFLLTCNRPETPSCGTEFDERAQEDREHSRSGQQKIITCHIGRVNGKQVIEKRIKFATESDGLPLEDQIKLMDFQEAFARAGSPGPDGRSHIDEIEAISASTRAFLQLITSAAAVYFREGLSKYQFTENAMLHAQKYPAIPYYYKNTTFGLERHTNPDSNKVHDINHLPPIMTFPFPEDCPDLGSDANIGLYSLGVRVIQCLWAVNNQQVTINQRELTGLVSAVFGFAPMRVDLIIDEFIDFDLIAIGQYSQERGRLEGEMLSITAKALAILKSYLFDPTYLSLSALVVPIPSALRNEIEGEYYFRIASPRDASRATGLPRWVGAKIWNSIGLSLLIKEALEQTGHKLQDILIGESLSDFPAGVNIKQLIADVANSSLDCLKKFAESTPETCNTILESLENRRPVEGSLRRSMNVFADLHTK